MLTLNDATVGDFALCDAQLLGIAWEAEGRDLRLDLELAGRRPATLKCSWATGVTIDLRTEPGVASLALSWEARFERIENAWHLVFEFPPHGRIELTCTEARVDYTRVT